MSVPVKFFSTEMQDRQFDALSAISRVITRSHYVMGPEVERFQQAFAEYLGARHCVGVGNGTDALEIALRALDIQAGQEVVCVANAGFYAPTAIHALGASPSFVDIDPATMTMSPKALEQRLARTPAAAVVVTHLYGQAADLDRLNALCQARGIPLIEDCAQAHGAMAGNRRTGSVGTLGCFSFYPTKNLGALGDGGAIVTNDSALHDKVQALRQYGWQRKYHVGIPGGRNSRLDEIQAAVLSEKLPLLDSWNDERRRLAKRYNQAFADLPVILPHSIDNDNVAHLYVLRTPHRDALKAHLASQQIGCDIHYPVPCHRQPAYPALSAQGDLAQCETACAQVLTLPCYPGMPPADHERVVDAVRGFFEGVPA